MLKKTVKFKDFNDVERTEDLYFHVSKASVLTSSDEAYNEIMKIGLDLQERGKFLEDVKEEDKDTIYNMLHNHAKFTKSKKAAKVMEHMNDELKRFVKVVPLEYKRILEGIKTEEKLDLVEASDG